MLYCNTGEYLEFPLLISVLNIVL